MLYDFVILVSTSTQSTITHGVYICLLVVLFRIMYTFSLGHNLKPFILLRYDVNPMLHI